MNGERATEHDYVRLLRAWVASLKQRFRLDPAWESALDRLDRRLTELPATVTAYDVGRLFHPLEKHRMVTRDTPGADRVLHYLIEAGRDGPMEKCSPELREWFRKHYMWSSGSVMMPMQVSELNTQTSDEAMRHYFGNNL
jgi:hypothetical protein